MSCTRMCEIKSVISGVNSGDVRAAGPEASAGAEDGATLSKLSVADPPARISQLCGTRKEYVPPQMFCMMYQGVVPLNGALPVQRKYNTQPNPHTSDRNVVYLSRSISGDTYKGLPSKVSANALLMTGVDELFRLEDCWLPDRESFAVFARGIVAVPKSINFKCPSYPTSIFSGLISRCNTPII